MQPNDLEASLAALPAKLDATFAAIKAKAPKATLVVLPYLRVMPAVPAPCPPSVPISTPVLYYLVGFGDKLHTAIKQAATRAKARFVDSYLPKGHDACVPAARRWIQGQDPSTTALDVPPERGGHAGAGDDDPQGAQDQVGPSTGVMRPASLDLVGLVDLLEELPDLGRLEPAMTAEGADGRDLAGACPTGDRLGVHPEHRGDFGRSEQLFGLGSGVLGHAVLAVDTDPHRGLGGIGPVCPE